MAITLSEHDVSITAAAATGILSPGLFVSDAEERALRVVGWWLDESERRSMAGEPMPSELTAMFYEWLDDPCDRWEKAKALDLFMEKCCDDPCDDRRGDPCCDRGCDPAAIRPDDERKHTIFNIH